MYWKGVCVVEIGSEVSNLTITVAGDVLDSGVTGGTLVKTLDRHDGEDLVYRPRVAEALEQGEVTEILVCQQLVNLHQFLGDMFQTLGECVDLMTYTPVHCLYFSTCLQIDNTMREKVEHLLTDLFRIVPVLQHVTRGEVVPYLIKVFY